LEDYQSNVEYLIDPHNQSDETHLLTGRINMTLQLR
jgi:hypothetical protein